MPEESEYVSIEQAKEDLEKTQGLLRKLNNNLDRDARDLFQNMSPEEVAEYVHKNNANQVFERYLNQLASPERVGLLAEAFDNYERNNRK